MLVSLVLPSGLYGIIAFTEMIADMDADARVAAESVQYVIRSTPGRWQDNTAELDSIAAGWFNFDEYGTERLRRRGRPRHQSAE